MNKRYTTIPNTNIILDNLTGEKIPFKKQVIIKKLNEINEQADKNAEKYYELKYK